MVPCEPLDEATHLWSNQGAFANSLSPLLTSAGASSHVKKFSACSHATTVSWCCHKTEVLRGAANRAGLPTSANCHGLRHFYASQFGESVKTVQVRLGHASASETLDTYSYLWPDSEDCGRRAIDEVLNRDGADISRTSEA